MGTGLTDDITDVLTGLVSENLKEERAAAARDYADLKRFQEKFSIADHQLRDLKDNIEAYIERIHSS